MKKIFIYYSKTGNGEMVREYYEKNGYDIRKVEARRGLPKSFFWQMMVGGMLAGFNHKAKLKDFNYDIKDYDEVVIGSPIWNGKFACPINTLLSKLDLNKKKVTFILYSGGGSAPKAIKKINKKYKANIIELKEPKKYPDNLKKLNE
jgi:flavodoxin